MSDAALGVFDSGLGGLTVVKALRALCPNEAIVYLGDTARVPYGSRSAETIIKYALGCGRALARRDIKALVVACNTVSGVALEQLESALKLPVLGVIAPGARAGLAMGNVKRLGVMATRGTVESGAYPREVAKLDKTVTVVAQAAPLLVPLAEEGWIEGEVPRLVARQYLTPLRDAAVDAIILGCTHFPILRSAIEQEARSLWSSPVRIVDSAEATAEYVKGFLQGAKLEAKRQTPGNLELWVTDIPKSFSAVAERFLGEQVGAVEVIDL